MTQQLDPLNSSSHVQAPASPSREPTTVAFTHLGPLHTIPADDESDSDLEPIPGGRVPYAVYPNCCRWHLTDARNRYKWDPPTHCAPYAIRMASSNLYDPALGVILTLGGAPHQRIHSPLPSLSTFIRSPSPGLSPCPSPPLDPPPSPLTPPRSPLAVRRSHFMPPRMSTLPTPAKSTENIEVSARWYAITRGREIRTMQGWCVQIYTSARDIEILTFIIQGKHSSARRQYFRLVRTVVCYRR